MPTDALSNAVLSYLAYLNSRERPGRFVSLQTGVAKTGNKPHVVGYQAVVFIAFQQVELKNRISSQFECSEIFITEFTPVMGVHTGPGLIGIAFYSEERRR